MRHLGTFSLAGLLLLVTAIAVAIGGWAKSARLERERDELAALLRVSTDKPNEYYLRDVPISVAMSDQNGMRLDGNWYASVNSEGVGTLDVSNLLSKTSVAFKATPQQLDALRDAVIKEHFFDLPDQVGGMVPDGSTQSITIVIGEFSKSVRINYLENILATPSAYSAQAPDEAARTLRVWLAARDFFSDPQAADNRPYQEKLLPRLDQAKSAAPPPAQTTAQSMPPAGGSTSN